MILKHSYTIILSSRYTKHHPYKDYGVLYVTPFMPSFPVNNNIVF